MAYHGLTSDGDFYAVVRPSAAKRCGSPRGPRTRSPGFFRGRDCSLIHPRHSFDPSAPLVSQCRLSHFRALSPAQALQGEAKAALKVCAANVRDERYEFKLSEAKAALKVCAIL